MIETEWRLRLRFMIDLVFASAMTILIINFEIPVTVETESSMEFMRILSSQSSQFSIFIISFLIIAVYWVKNLEYYRILKNIDKKIIWLHLVYLILVMMLPVANILFGLFPSGVGIRVLFSVIMVIMGAITYSSMYYAKRKEFLDDRFELSYVKKSTDQLLHEPIIAIFAAVMAFIQPYFWDLSFILVPLVILIGKKVRIKYFSKLKSESVGQND